MITNEMDLNINRIYSYTPIQQASIKIRIASVNFE